MIKLEKNVPLPEPGRYRYGDLKHTMETMQVGESFTYDKSKLSSVTGTMTHIRKASPHKRWTTRTIDSSTVRIWRIS